MSDDPAPKTSAKEKPVAIKAYFWYLQLIPTICSIINLILLNIVSDHVKSSDRPFIVLTMISSIMKILWFLLSPVSHDLLSATNNRILTAIWIILWFGTSLAAVCVRRRADDDRLNERVFSTIWTFNIVGLVSFSIYLSIYIVIMMNNPGSVPEPGASQGGSSGSSFPKSL